VLSGLLNYSAARIAELVQNGAISPAMRVDKNMVT